MIKEIEINTKDEIEYIHRFGTLPDEVLKQIHISKAINTYIQKRNRISGKYG